MTDTSFMVGLADRAAHEADGCGSRVYRRAMRAIAEQLRLLCSNPHSDSVSPHLPDLREYADYLMKIEPDFIIGSRANPYMHRWFIFPRTGEANLYLHKFLRSDDDRALHDHPWPNCSWLLKGTYDEVVFDGGPPSVEVLRALPPTKILRRTQGAFVVRHSGTHAHRVALLRKGDVEQPVVTLFMTGPKDREWGFHCPRRWKHWEDYIKFAEGDARGGVSEIGRGCDD